LEGAEIKKRIPADLMREAPLEKLIHGLNKPHDASGLRVGEDGDSLPSTRTAADEDSEFIHRDSVVWLGD
jgi:hypothetical protein